MTASPSVRVERLRAEHHEVPALGIGEAAPRLSWVSVTDAPGWRQSAYELEVDGEPCGVVPSDEQVLVPWPSAPLRSRQGAEVRVRVAGADGSWSAWSDPLQVEAGLLEADDWVATWITPVGRDPLDAPAPAPFLRRAFDVGSEAGPVVRARLYVTSAGIHRIELNGTVVGDHVLAPGWSSYPHRLRYETHDVTRLLVEGENVLGAVLADGWWRGHLTWAMRRNTYGDRLGLLAQLEVVRADGTIEVVTSDGAWRTATGPVRSADLYLGEEVDARLDLGAWSSPGHDDSSWGAVEPFEPVVGDLVARLGPPVRRTQELAVREVLVTPSGRTVLDYGQNLVGRLRMTVDGESGTTVVLRHAEVLEHGEPAYGPLRNATATDRYTLRGDGPETWEPDFTFHGFRYAEVEGWPGALDPAAFTAVVLHTDMERTGDFHCSHELVDRLHENVVWGLRGNVVDVPTDCPQRDERLGWTGDLQVFTPTAAHLYDVSGMLADWLADLSADQRPDGSVPVVVPSVSGEGVFLPPLAAAWSDAAAVVPWEVYRHGGDAGVLRDQFASMRAWVDHVTARTRGRRLWTGDFQYGDWLDPTAPEDKPWLARTDRDLVATAYWCRSARIVAEVAAVLGDPQVADTYARLADEIAEAFRQEYLTPRGRLMSDTVTAYALALSFDLVADEEQRRRMARHLARHCRASFFTVTTGFVGTPLVLPALSAGGHDREAYAMLTQTGCPSWLYPVTMGATTIWERWDSMLPDGSVNGNGMTSFNHYAFGAVAQWLHEEVGGLAPAEPGYRRLRIAPRPGPGLTWAQVDLRTPYGPASCRWELDGRRLELQVSVPPNASAVVALPGRDGPDAAIEVAAGRHRWSYEVAPEVAAAWNDEVPAWTT